MKHRWVSMRLVDENDLAMDVIECKNCNYRVTYTQVNLDTRIHRGEEVDVDCADTLVRRVMIE